MNEEDLEQVKFKLMDLRRTMSSKVTWYEIRTKHKYFFVDMTKRIDQILSYFEKRRE